ncbi:MAG: HAMP domain-containing histidine kinase [Lachnoclostridium sp.]|nr:HAMP domain-containing histidine kinase [Lachnospira sp.]MCM1246884.1 HAMP domain-containing histidine kinase [Lachnoclostridium sp.]
MFHKIRLRLTLLSGGITTLITILMTLGYLYISEKNLIANRLLSCRNDIYTIASNLEQQTVVSLEWLSKLESGGSYYISLMDNQTPFWFNGRNQSDSHLLITRNAWSYYRENMAQFTEHIISYRSHYKEFTYYEGKSPFYCFVITLETKESSLEMLLMLPFASIEGQIIRQRLGFLCMISLALIAIWLFAWFFTGKLLMPIEENRQKQNRFIAAASHELRTPLAVILSCAESQLESADAGKSPALIRDMSAIKNESLRMKFLLEDLLTLQSRDAGHFSIEKAPASLDTLLLNAYEAFESMAQSKNINMSVTLPEDAIPLCNCDKERIYQVITILLHNAISYTPEGGHITLSLELMPKYFVLSVSDNGVGISDSEKEKVFERFYRSEKSRSAKGHFGLGLPIAYEIISAHHGSIAVHDTKGGGAMFIVRLPA